MHYTWHHMWHLVCILVRILVLVLVYRTLFHKRNHLKTSCLNLFFSPPHIGLCFLHITMPLYSFHSQSDIFTVNFSTPISFPLSISGFRLMVLSKSNNHYLQKEMIWFIENLIADHVTQLICVYFSSSSSYSTHPVYLSLSFFVLMQLHSFLQLQPC